MEYHYFTIEDIEMLTFNGIPHLHNHLNYLIHTDKDQKFTNEDSVRNVSFIFDNEGNSKALRWTDDSKIYVLDIPSELCLETDFYNFADEIYAYQYPNEMESIWNSIYEKRNSERQVIFPYIEPSMIVGEIKQGKFIEFNHEEQNLELDEIEK